VKNIERGSKGLTSQREILGQEVFYARVTSRDCLESEVSNVSLYFMMLRVFTLVILIN
jgi:hypothetical protein